MNTEQARAELKEREHYLEHLCEEGVGGTDGYGLVCEGILFLNKISVEDQTDAEKMLLERLKNVADKYEEENFGHGN